ncbi:MAG: methyltransferase type 11 [Bacteroides sp. SM23_62_1]|nr:MAG: methyltransferase type 11 [Bacteroides sp. SM23_62_1]
MQYDPIKKRLGNFFNRSPWLRVLFYHLLNLLLLRTWYIKKELKKFRNHTPGDVNVLDAGSGFGQYTHYMAGLSKKWKIKGVDIKSGQIEDCINFFKRIGMDKQVFFEVADLTNLDEQESYHLILCVDVMEHIEEDEKVFRNFARALQSGGFVLISTPSDQGGSDVHDEGDESFIEEHVRDGYNSQELVNKLKSAGFSSIHSRFSYGIPGKISWKLSMKYPIILLNLSKLFFIILPLYYILTFPFAILLNILDIHMKHQSGTGLIVKAYKI